jgi:TM2 domain-containing membrane protein YozV
MKTFTFIAAICALSLMLGSGIMAQQNSDDVVYLKNGSIIKGTIIEQIPGKTIKIQTQDGNIFVYGFDDIAKITKEQSVKQASVISGPGPKNTGVAFVLSWLVPGAGQVYNNQPIKGAIQFGICATGYILFATQLPYTKDVYVDYGSYSTWEERDFGNAGTAWTGFAVALGCHIWSMIDAPVTASRLNKKLGYSFNQINIDDNLTISMMPTASERGRIAPKLALTYRF